MERRKWSLLAHEANHILLLQRKSSRHGQVEEAEKECGALGKDRVMRLQVEGTIVEDRGHEAMRLTTHSSEL